MALGNIGGLRLGAVSAVALSGCLLTTSFDGLMSADAGSSPDGGEGGSDEDSPVKDDHPDDIPATPDTGSDSTSSCPCPAGTSGSSGDCTITGSLPNGACTDPLVVPSCTMTLHFQLCSTDARFPYVNSTTTKPCVFDGGTEARPTAFFRLGASATGFSLTIQGAGLFASPSLPGCTQATPDNCFDISAGVIVNSPPSNNAEIAIGKTTSSACDAITLTVAPR